MLLLLAIAQIEVTLYVSSVRRLEDDMKMLLGWSGDYDFFDEQARRLFGMVHRRASGYYREQGDVELNLTRRDKVLIETNNDFEFLVYVDDVYHFYSRILGVGWNVISS